MTVYTCSIYLQWFVAESIRLAKQLFHDAPHYHSAGPWELLYSDPYNQKQVNIVIISNLCIGSEATDWGGAKVMDACISIYKLGHLVACHFMHRIIWQICWVKTWYIPQVLNFNKQFYPYKWFPNTYRSLTPTFFHLGHAITSCLSEFWLQN